MQGVEAAKGRALSNNWTNVNYTRPRDLCQADCVSTARSDHHQKHVSTGEEAILVAASDQPF